MPRPDRIAKHSFVHSADDVPLHAVPTIVEVKRSTDTRIRREVVGQMLDYAANAVVYWPVETIRAEFEAQHENPQQAIADFLALLSGEDLRAIQDVAPL